MNVIILGVGHSGTTILTRFLAALGWQHNAALDAWSECPTVRDANAAMIQTGHPLPLQNLNTIVAKLKTPWVIKDPRFVLTLRHWKPTNLPRHALLIWLRRDPDEVDASYNRRLEWLPGTRTPGMYGHAVADLETHAQTQFNAWPYQKLIVRHEHMQKAANLYR